MGWFLQLLLVVVPDWDSVDGVLYCYERDTLTTPWKLVDAPVAVTLGKKGMAWGRGVHDLTGHEGLHKREGDGRAPAGVFSLGTAFGDRSYERYAKNIPFLPITEDLEYVDDPLSTYYNQFVTAETLTRDWQSSERMHEVGPSYALGVVVQHNCQPVEPGMGSAIFMHIWRGKGRGTDGCTAMAEEDLCKVVSWLNEERKPCLVQLPLEEYMKKKTEWNLPDENVSN